MHFDRQSKRKASWLRLGLEYTSVYIVIYIYASARPPVKRKASWLRLGQI